MLNRSITSELENWAASKRRKPLILRGARQVGKTTAVNQFAQDFDHYIDLNLEIEEEAELFENGRPIEIKAGKSGTLRSLHQFIDQAPHHFAIRLYSGTLDLQKTKTPEGKEFVLLNLPSFLAAKIFYYMAWMVKNQSS